MKKHPEQKIQIKLKRYIARLLKKPEDIEDVAQEAFLKVLEAGSKGEIRYPKTYLYRTARNLALNTLTKKSPLLTDSIEDLLSQDVLTKSKPLEDDIMIQERFEIFCRAMVNLPATTRQVLILRKYHGLTRNEVASKLNISVSSVEKHLAKALKSCIHYLDVSGYPLDSDIPLRKSQ